MDGSSALIQTQKEYENSGYRVRICRLRTGTCFAETGNQVLCLENNQEKVTAMQAGEVPIYEPELETLFKRN